LELDNNSESFVHFVKRMMDGVTEPAGPRVTWTKPTNIMSCAKE